MSTRSESSSKSVELEENACKKRQEKIIKMKKRNNLKANKVFRFKWKTLIRRFRKQTKSICLPSTL